MRIQESLSGVLKNHRIPRSEMHRDAIVRNHGENPGLQFWLRRPLPPAEHTAACRRHVSHPPYR